MIQQENNGCTHSLFCQQTSNNEKLIQQYTFKIEAVFDHQEAREAFRKFLKKDCLNEGMFLLDIYESLS